MPPWSCSWRCNGSSNRNQIYSPDKKEFGGAVRDFKTPPDDTLARGRRAGQITDAFSIPYILANHIIKNNGNISKNR